MKVQRHAAKTSQKQRRWQIRGKSSRACMRQSMTADAVRFSIGEKSQ
jgi:hypothetical protein